MINADENDDREYQKWCDLFDADFDSDPSNLGLDLSPISAKPAKSGCSKKSKREKAAARKARADAEVKLKAFFTTLTTDLEALSPYKPEVAFAVDRLKTRMRKRAELENPELHLKAHEDFIALNAHVGSRPYIMEPAIRNEARDFILYALERQAKRYDEWSLQECLPKRFLFENWRFGPGTSNGVTGTGTVQKFDQPMTSTAECEPLVLRLRMLQPYFQAYDSLYENTGVLRREGSRLTTVLKNETQVRTIAIEPSGNMAIQLSGGAYIEETLRGLGLDIRKQQDLNKRLAHKGSVDGTVCTIDLKSASDMQGLDLIRDLWPKDWFDFFSKTRSPQTELPDGRVVRMNMISTMGNGYTFPMMTLTICALIYAMRRVDNGPRRFIDWTNTCVFGDDIIVPTHEYARLCEILAGGGYVINHDKSYHAGPFRESCGGDYYDGYDVTPFYVKSVASYSDVYVAINQVLSWSGKHQLPLVRSAKYLISLLDKKVLLVPEWHADTAGIRCTTGPRNYKFLRPEPIYLEYKGRYMMSLACGGYLTQRDDALYYCPRETGWLKYKVKKARLPSFYLDGWDPLTRSRRTSSYVDLLVDMLT